MEAITGSIGIAALLLLIILYILLILSPLLIWSNTRQIVKLLNIQNIYLKHTNENIEKLLKKQ